MGVGSNLSNGGLTSSPICIPSQLGDLVIMTIYPPIYVFMNEYYHPEPFNIMKIIISFILTCFFYFPGLVHALELMRTRGPIKY